MRTSGENILKLGERDTVLEILRRRRLSTEKLRELGVDWQRVGKSQGKRSL